jgi:Flp pilus assembly protein TadG
MGLKTWIGGMGRGLWAFTRRMADDRRGNVAMLFAVTMPVLILMTLGGVDIHRVSTVRANLQDALDAATLAAARSPYTADDDLREVGLAALKANLKPYPDITLREADTTFVLNDDDVVVASSRIDVKTLVANIILPPYGQFMDETLPVGVRSEVDRSSRNIEVAMVLDVTGSMAGQRIIDLRAAAKELIGIVVQPVQTPYYSKIAIVPYSMGVNLDTRAASARGPITGSTDITGATWTTGVAVNVTGASKTDPVKVTAPGHTFVNGDVVWITGVGGMTSLNKKAFTVRNADAAAGTFTLRRNGANVDGTRSSYKTYTSGGTVRKCQFSDCSVVITAPNHGLVNNNYVRITDVGGMTQINGDTFLVGNATTDTYTIDVQADDELREYTSGGKSWCAQEGCTYFAFENMDEDLVTHVITTCVSERTGTAAYTDAAPGAGAWTGRVYPRRTSDCLGNTLSPLSSDIGTLEGQIDDLRDEGSTAGQIGIAWGWYAVSPNFNSLWSGNAAAPYDISETLKAVVIMTDGEFNTPYCRGVVARNAGSGAVGESGRIDCNSTNGSPFAQGKALCDGMKARGIVVYTVGFQTTAGGAAEDVLEHCASTPANFFSAGSGTDLSEAFKAIGRDIIQLRISR